MQYIGLIIPSFVSPSGEAEASATNTDKGFFIYCYEKTIRVKKYLS